MKRKSLFLFSLCVFISFSVMAQQRSITTDLFSIFEMRVGLGSTYLSGDIKSKAVQPAFNLSLNYFLIKNLGFKAQFQYAKFKGSDEFTNLDEYMNGIYNFSTNAFEGSMIMEAYLLKAGEIIFHRYFDFEGKKSEFNICLLVGYSFLGYFPKTEFNNEEYTAPETYKKHAVAIPHGIGLRYMFNDKMGANLQVVRNHTINDYLEGYGPETTDNFDRYWITSVTFTYRFLNTKRY